ncbi:LOW QUALITY PROTEIN: Endogenous retrovirus group FC1 Env polyprotein [Plecturocebus cupreus]
MPVGAAAVPEADPNWDYQDGRDGHHRRDQMLHGHAKRSPKDVVKKDIGPGSAPVLGHPLDLARIVNYGTTDNSSCNTTVKVRSTHHAPPGGYFWCNGTLTKVINASLPLPCVPVTLVPQLKVYGQAKFQSLLTPPPPVRRNKRAIFLPMIVGLSLASSLVATGIGSGAMGYSVTSAAQLEDKLRVAIEASAASGLSSDKSPQVTLQNRWALDLLTAEKGGTCMFLQEECCYYINESGLVEENINTLHHLQEDLRKKQNTGVLSLSWFLQTRMREIGRVAVNQMLLHPFIWLSVEAPTN